MSIANLIVKSLTYIGTLQCLLNSLLVTQLSTQYSVCVIREKQHDVRLTTSLPQLTILLDDNSTKFEETLRTAIDAGCDGFVLLEGALLPFLDHYQSAHEAAIKRTANKRIIALTQLDPSMRKRLVEHVAMEDLPNMLVVVPDAMHQEVELYTTHFTAGEPRGIVVDLIRLEQIDPIRCPEPSHVVDYFPDKFANMQGRPIRLATLHYPPCTIITKKRLGEGNARPTVPANYSLEIDGTELLMVVELCRRHNCSVDVELAASGAWGELYANGTSDGLLGSIIHRRADLAMAALYRWVDWNRHIWFSMYTGRSGVSCLVPKPQRLPSWRTPFLAFPPCLWFMVSITFCIGTTVVWATERQRQQLHPSDNAEARYRLIDAFFFMSSLYVEQSVRLRNDLLAGSILLAFLLFGGFMIGNSYAGGLAYVMTIPRYEKALTTTADVANSGITVVGGSIVWINSLLMTDQPALVTIRNNFQVYDMDTLNKFLHTRRDMSYMHERLQFGSFALESYVDFNASQLVQPLKEEVYYGLIVSAGRKTWPLMGRYDDLILQIQQNGILRRWELGSVIRNTGLKMQRSLANMRVTDNSPVKLLLAHFLGVYFILFAGLTLATVSFLLEILIHRSKTGNRTVQTRDI
ncbi:glutamate receptor 1-like isoform X2 [Anopheles albimanus]|uniref:glutamate receptor 1-like isoform X2 n=1 Tax=Anopheles albimanus TaxID=7167 RepID=UPI00163FB300|nr:glutamate receptor 1-like isoform X2 [Anopheles albimanus]